MLPCRVRDPDRKGKVESAIAHTQAALKGLRFETLAAAQAYLDRWDARWADTRIHGTTERQVTTMFAEERPTRTPPTTLTLLAHAARAGAQIGTLCEAIHRQDGEAWVRRLLGVPSLVKKHGPAAFGVRVTRTPFIPTVVRALVERARAGTGARPGSA